MCCKFIPLTLTGVSPPALPFITATTPASFNPPHSIITGRELGANTAVDLLVCYNLLPPNPFPWNLIESSDVLSIKGADQPARWLSCVSKMRCEEERWNNSGNDVHFVRFNSALEINIIYRISSLIFLLDLWCCCWKRWCGQQWGEPIAPAMREWDERRPDVSS